MDSLTTYSTYGNQILPPASHIPARFPPSGHAPPHPGDNLPEILGISSLDDVYGGNRFASRSSSISLPSKSTASSPTAVSSLGGLSLSGGSTSTLFVGDLSFVCNEERLRELFSNFGRIDSIHLKKSDFNQNRTHLSYGFVKFDCPESAQLAYQALQGKMYLGRKLRLGFADDYHPQAHPHQPYVPGRHHFDGNGGAVNKVRTAQLYVTFATNNMYLPISELTLRELFNQFGEVSDVTIKQIEINQEVGIQSGYGFVHYVLSEEGIRSANLAVESVHNHTIQSIRYQCRFSHGLKKLLASLSPAPTPQPKYPTPAFSHRPEPMLHHQQQQSFPLASQVGLPRGIAMQSPSFETKAQAPFNSYPSHNYNPTMLSSPRGFVEDSMFVTSFF